MPYLNNHLGAFIEYVQKENNVDLYVLGHSSDYRDAFINDFSSIKINIIDYYSMLRRMNRKVYSKIIFHGIFYFKLVPIILFLGKSNISILSESFNPNKNKWVNDLIKRIFIKLINNKAGLVQLVALGKLEVKKQYEHLGLRFDEFYLSAYLPLLNDKYNPRLKKKDGKLRLAFVGQFIERKNIDLLIELVVSKEWEKVADNVDLYFIGSGESAKINKISNGVKVMTSLDRKEVLSKMEEIDVLILPSHFDGWGAVVNEAISRGCALLLSKYVGAGEVFLKERENGFLISTDNCLDIIKHLNEWILHPPLLVSMQAKSYELFNTLHNPEVQYKFLN